MTSNSYFQIAFYVATLLVLAKPLGWYMARVYEGEPVGLNRLLAPIERLIYRLSGVSPKEEMRWTDYAVGMLVHFSAQTRMSGVNIEGRHIRKGAADAIRAYVEELGGQFPPEYRKLVDDVARRGSTPLVVAEGARVLGVSGSHYFCESFFRHPAQRIRIDCVVRLAW